MTHKRGMGQTRYEHEEQISERQFTGAWPPTAGRRLRKTRYTIPYTYRDKNRKLVHCLIQTDVYHGVLEGHIVAEVEFPSEEEARQFVAPAWFSREVTGIEEYSNRSLASQESPRS